jgi:uncharacterized protein with HEPN domain
MKKDSKIFLKHVLESIDIVEKYAESFTEFQFLKNIQLQDSISRRLEIIGEAVKNLPLGLRNKYPNVPWKKIAGFRDVLIHAYFETDFILVWKVVKKELPILKKQIEKILIDLGVVC